MSDFSHMPSFSSMAVLGRARSFLTQMKAANESLQHVAPESVNIEQVDESKPYIRIVRASSSHTVIMCHAT